MTLLFAATYPHRVDSVILHGSGARLAPADMTEAERQTSDRTPDPVCRGLGYTGIARGGLLRPVDGGRRRVPWVAPALRAALGGLRFAPRSAPADDGRQRCRDPPEGRRPRAHPPPPGDGAMPIELGHELAELLPDAELIELDGADHFAYLGDMDGWMDHVERWVTGTVASRSAEPTTGDVRIRTLGRFAVTVGGRGGRHQRVGLPASAHAAQAARRRPRMAGHARRTRRCALAGRSKSRTARAPVCRYSSRPCDGCSAGAWSPIARRWRSTSTTCGPTSRPCSTATDDRRVIDSYAGEFLPEERYEDWAAPMREQARSHFTRAAHRRLAALLEDGNAGAAIALAESVLAADMYDEAAYAALIDAHEQAGDPAASRPHRPANARGNGGSPPKGFLKGAVDDGHHDRIPARPSAPAPRPPAARPRPSPAWHAVHACRG